MAQSPRGHCLHVAAHLSSSTLVLQCVAFSRASKGALRCRRWTCESSPISSHHVGYADFPHPLHATIYNHMFSSSSDPTYITSIRKSGVRRCGGVPVVLVLVAAAAVLILGRGMLWSQCLRKYCPFSMRTATRMQHQKLERQDRTFSVAETTILSLTLYVYIYTHTYSVYIGAHISYGIDLHNEHICKMQTVHSIVTDRDTSISWNIIMHISLYFYMCGFSVFFS